ncbi:MAG: homocysteine S-methyltransferase [Rhodothermales bacterium]|nr:homocysteine S-methyltransferase [Rhodothermales bacterium]
MATENPFLPFLNANGFVILDGGLGTSLEAEGVNLDDPLWSARVLLEDPAPLRRVHRGFLEAGADVIASCTYQATIPGLKKAGLGESDARRLLRDAATLAVEVRDAFVSDQAPRGPKPIVAASIGPYGAYLADGSEYSGQYGLSAASLREFHRDRWHLLADSGADILALETVPSMPETEALLNLLAESENAWACISFSCRDAHHLADGTPLEEPLSLIAGCARIAAVGANCFAPALGAGLASTFASLTDLPVMLYPNSGEAYDPGRKTWSGSESVPELARTAGSWQRLGAACLGGCCRTTYEDIRALRAVLENGGAR